MKTSKNEDSPGEIDPGAEDHAPDLYRHDAIAQKLHGLEVITDEHIAFFRQEGYLAVENAFSAEEIEAGLAGLLHLIMGGNPQFKGVTFEAKAKGILSTLGVEARQDAVRKLMFFVDYDERLQAISHHESLMAVLTRVLGEEPWMFQDMALLKPPRLGREKPWHQEVVKLCLRCLFRASPAILLSFGTPKENQRNSRRLSSKRQR